MTLEIQEKRPQSGPPTVIEVDFWVRYYNGRGKSCCWYVRRVSWSAQQEVKGWPVPLVMIRKEELNKNCRSTGIRTSMLVKIKCWRDSTEGEEGVGCLSIVRYWTTPSRWCALSRWYWRRSRCRLRLNQTTHVTARRIGSDYKSFLTVHELTRLPSNDL